MVIRREGGAHEFDVQERERERERERDALSVIFLSATRNSAGSIAISTIDGTLRLRSEIKGLLSGALLSLIIISFRASVTCAVAGFHGG